MPRDTEERCPWSVCRTLQAFTTAERWRGKKKNDPARKTCRSKSIAASWWAQNYSCVKRRVFILENQNSGIIFDHFCSPTCYAQVWTQILSQPMVLAEIDMLLAVLFLLPNGTNGPRAMAE